MMKKTVVRAMETNGRLLIPANFREVLGLNGKVEITLEDDCVVVRPFVKNAKCAVTGKTTNLKVYSGGIILSDEGAEILLKELGEKDE